MDLDGKDLRLAREFMDLRQQEVADHLNVGLSTYQRWEQGKRRPRLSDLYKLYELFKDAFRKLGIEVDLGTDLTVYKPSGSASQSSSEPKNGIVTFADNDLGTRLLFLVTPTYKSYDDTEHRMKRILKDLDLMNAANKNYQITRREAFSRVVALPIGALQLKTPGQTVRSGLYGIALPTCAAGIAGCWELRKSSEAADLATAFDGVSLYLPVLDDIVKYSAQYRQKACDLAARCAILKTILSWHCSNHAAATCHAQQALEYSKQSGDICLQLSAYSKLAWAYLYENERKYPLALNTALEAKRALEEAEKKHIPIPACIRDGIYSMLAMMQVVNKQNCDIALGKAGELNPGVDCHAFMEFTETDLEIEIGLVYQRKGNQIEAMARFEKVVDPKKLTLRNTQVHSAKGRVGVINSMALSVLKRKTRDMEEVIHYWKAGIQGAATLHSEHFFDEALTTYNIMKYIWPGEQRIEELDDLTVHWSVA